MNEDIQREYTFSYETFPFISKRTGIMGTAGETGCQTEFLGGFCRDRNPMRTGVDEVRRINLSVKQNADTHTPCRRNAFIVQRLTTLYSCHQKFT
jgi:hypothetical protein